MIIIIIKIIILTIVATIILIIIITIIIIIIIIIVNIIMIMIILIILIISTSGTDTLAIWNELPNNQLINESQKITQKPRMAKSLKFSSRNCSTTLLFRKTKKDFWLQKNHNLELG